MRARVLALVIAFAPLAGLAQLPGPDDPFPPTLEEATRIVGGMRRVSPLRGRASSRLGIPAAVNTPGAYGAYFRTKTSVLLIDTSSSIVTARFYPSSGPMRTSTFGMQPGETRTFPNLLQDLFGVTGAGAVELSTPSTSTDIAVSSEVYVDGPNGRYSTATAAYDSLDFLGSTYYDWTVGVTVDGANRSNIACFNSSGSSAIVRAALYDAPSPGPLLKTFEFALNGYQWLQLSVDVPVNGGTILWKPYGGLNYCYAVNVNNTSNDGTFLHRFTWVP